MKNRTVIINKEDINNSLHPNLWENMLDSFGIDSDSTEICIELSPLDENKKTGQDEKIEKLNKYVEEKTKLFKNVDTEKGKTVIEVLQNIEFILQ